MTWSRPGTRGLSVYLFLSLPTAISSSLISLFLPWGAPTRLSRACVLSSNLLYVVRCSRLRYVGSPLTLSRFGKKKENLRASFTLRYMPDISDNTTHSSEASGMLFSCLLPHRHLLVRRYSWYVHLRYPRVGELQQKRTSLLSSLSRDTYLESSPGYLEIHTFVCTTLTTLD